jgi:hypothetical protein
VRVDDQAVADFFDRCVDQGLSPDRFARLWCHTHPGDSAVPSATDEDTFERCFNRCNWSVMFILARKGRTYCRMKFTAGPGAQVELPVAVDWSGWPACLCDTTWLDRVAQWQAEYERNIQQLPALASTKDMPFYEGDEPDDPWQPFDWCPELDVLRFAPIEENHEPPRAS